jgi:hypothetical protein
MRKGSIAPKLAFHPAVTAPLCVLVLLMLGGGALAGPLTDKGTQPPLNHMLLSPSDCGGCHGG